MVHIAKQDRRQFLRRSASLAAAWMAVPCGFERPATAEELPTAKNDRFGIGAIGMRYQGSVIAEKALPYGEIVAICDVDREIAEKARGNSVVKPNCSQITGSCSREPMWMS